MKNDEIHRRIQESDKLFDELHLRMGILLTTFTGVEIELKNAISLLVYEDNLDVGDIVADSLTYSQRVDLFDQLARYMLQDAQPREDLETLISKLRRAGNLRNEVAHSVWSYTIYDPHEKHGDQLFSQERARRKSRRGHPVSSSDDPFRLLDGAESVINTLEEELVSFETEYLC